MAFMGLQSGRRAAGWWIRGCGRLLATLVYGIRRKTVSSPASESSDKLRPLERFSLKSGVRRASAAMAPSPCALERKPSPVPGEGGWPLQSGGLQAVVRLRLALPVRSSAGDGESNLSRYGRGGEPKRAGEGAEPRSLWSDPQSALKRRRRYSRPCRLRFLIPRAPPGTGTDESKAQRRRSG